MQRASADTFDPEKVVYWYFRLGGFFRIENFVVHFSVAGVGNTERS
jgi:hypothetical protein